jgi:ribosomal protein S18 acetylase RimI-like enzyme
MTPRGWSELDHPKEWEWDVQEIIQRLRLPCKPRFITLLGHDEAGLGAVVQAEEFEKNERFEITVCAVEKRLRSRGGGYADEMLEQIIEAVNARVLDHGGTEHVLVEALIDPRNGPSQALFRRAGFKHRRERDGLQVWERTLAAPTPPTDG